MRVPRQIVLRYARECEGLAKGPCATLLHLKRQTKTTWVATVEK